MPLGVTDRAELCPEDLDTILVDFTAGHTGLNKAEIQMVLSELSAAIQFFNKQGQGVKLPGLGTYLPSIDLDGKLCIFNRLDKQISNSLNPPGAFRGEIPNRENIGKTSDNVVAIWNKDHP